MAKKPFMEMDLDDFEEKKDEGVIDEPSLDFDFDEDVEEITPSEDTSSSTEINDETTLSLPNDFWYKSENSTSDIAKAATDEDIVAAEKELGYKLPKAYKALIKQHNGGRLNRCICPTSSKTSWADDHVEISTLFGIDKNKPSIFATKFYQDEWGYPNIGLAIGSTPTAGHTMVFLDYSKCGHDGEPSVVDIDQENNYEISVLANDFEEFINKLITRDEFEKEQSSEDNTSDDSLETPEIPEEPNLDEPEVSENDTANESTEETSVDESETIQEGALTNGIGRIRNELAKALAGKYVVSNLNPKTDEFNIKEKDAPVGSPTTYCTPTNNGLKVVTRGVGIPMKPHFSSIPLSQAFEKIKALFDKPELLTAESYVTDKAVTKFPYPSRFFQEAEEESTDDEEPEIPEMPDFGADDTDNEGDDSGEAVVTAEVEEKITPEGEDLSSFGMDTSDVQNDFDQKDVDSLNKLIAAESEAINDYFDASKDTRNEDLRTLFSDIGHEERFHLEQLMYSKAKLTGEKYEPRDPKVKEEYEELINGGMDEDTAAYTAMDKASMLPDDDGDDSDMEELEQESALICNMLYNNELLVSICEHCVSNDTITRDKNVAMFVEGYIMESIDNVSSAPKEMTKIKSPFSILAKGLGVAIAGLAKMSSIARDSMRRSNLKRARRKEWIQKHGIADLFKAGISLYLYNDKTSTMDFNTPCRYIDFLYRLTKAIGETCGVQLTQAAKHKSVPDPIKFTSVKEGMYKLSQVVFTKTKVVVTDANKTALQNEFFGYNDNKLNVAVTHGTDQVVRDSANIYNRLDAMILIIKQYAEISKAVLDQLSKLEGDVNSVYYKNRPVYNKAKDNMTEVIKKYNQFISATSHDLNQIMKLDNGLLKMTRERDMTEQGGGKWEGPDIRVNPKTQPQDPKYTQMKKKKGLFH